MKNKFIIIHHTNTLEFNSKCNNINRKLTHQLIALIYDLKNHMNI